MADIYDTRLGNLTRLLDQKYGGKKSLLAEKLGKGASYISRWYSRNAEHRRNISSASAREIEAISGMPSGWMDQPPGPIQAQPGPGSNMAHAPRARGDVPLISWVHAGQLSEAIDLLQPGDAEEWYASHRAHGPHTFALRVEGDSMVSDIPGAVSFPPGCVIIVDPDKAVTNGAKVVAKYIETNEATFKVYREDGPARYLKPLNTSYPMLTMDHQYEIVGVVIEKIEAV